MTTIDATRLSGRVRPSERILQFGEGNFLRAFVDWKIDRMNEAAGSDWGVVVVRPIAGGNPTRLDAQDGLYTVLSRGVDESGAAVSEPRVVACVRREVFAHGEWDAVLELARSPAITVVVTGVHPNKGKAADVRADLTIKGVTAPLPQPVTVTELDDGAVRIAGHSRVERARLGLGWNKFGMMAATATAAADAVFVRVPR